MIEYTLNKEFYNRFFRHTLTMIFVKLGFAVIAYLGIFSFYKDEASASIVRDVILTGFIVALINDFIRISICKERYYGFRIVFSCNSISVRGGRGPNFDIKFGDISKITEAGRGVFVRSANFEEYIFIPDTINNYAEIKRRLLTIRPIELSTT